jgi:hypothetical protein
VTPDLHALHVAAGLRAGRERTCGKKTGYGSEEAAYAAMNKPGSTNVVEAYPCAFCDCRLRIAIRSPISIACDAHGRDSCPACFSCTCTVLVDRVFVHGRRIFEWKLESGLTILRREPSQEGSGS